MNISNRPVEYTGDRVTIMACSNVMQNVNIVIFHMKVT